MKGPNQLQVLRQDANVTAADLLQVPDGPITDEGLRHNIRVGVQYVEAWLGGLGCVPLYHLMEDAATAEISRAQVWQWLRHGARTDDGRPVTIRRFDAALKEELQVIAREIGAERYSNGNFPAAAALFGDMIRKPDFDEFLTLPAYERLA
jgi:malate synthase